MSEGQVTEIPKGFDFKYEAFENIPVFIQGVRKVYNCETFPSVKSSYRIKRLCDAVQKEMKRYGELRKEIKDDDPERDKKLEELHAMAVPIKWGRMNVEELECLAGVSPADLLALEYLVEPTAFEA